ncbi:MAG: hypothetical protein U1E15_08125 [Hyphomicrobiales bacterium]
MACRSVIALAAGQRSSRWRPPACYCQAVVADLAVGKEELRFLSILRDGSASMVPRQPPSSARRLRAISLVKFSWRPTADA